MSDSCRRILFVLFAAISLMMFSVAVYAECDTDCDPYTSYCSDECDVCSRQGIDGCIAWRASTCGAHLSACLQDNCYPNWVETSRINYGSYGGNSWNSCDHHMVDLVTITDYNQCNTNSAYYSLTYCQNYIDGHKTGGFYPSCCNGYNEDYPYQALTCNGNHSCS